MIRQYFDRNLTPSIIVRIIKRLIADGWEKETRHLRHQKEFVNHPVVSQAKPLTDRSKRLLIDCLSKRLKGI